MNPDPIHDTPTASDAVQGEHFTTPTADRAPTPDESAAADRAADDVDLETVAAEYEAMIQRGAAVRGEGQIEPQE